MSLSMPSRLQFYSDYIILGDPQITFLLPSLPELSLKQREERLEERRKAGREPAIVPAVEMGQRTLCHLHEMVPSHYLWPLQLWRQDQHL